ncbi:MAG: RDD family protein [Bryobacteraceae bacterium]
MNRLTIVTPEGIRFSLTLAGPVTRMLAWLIDGAVILTATYLIGKLIAVVRVLSPDFMQALGILAYFAISIGYAMAFEWLWHGQTLGKRVLRLQVMDEQALPLHFGQIAIRNLLRVADCLPAFYLTGGIAVLMSGRSQRLGDMAANTVVVQHVSAPEPDPRAFSSGKFNSLLEYPHLVARLRHRIRPELVRLAVDALERREEFLPAARLDIFRELSSALLNVVKFPDEATADISREQFVRNVVDALMRRQPVRKTCPQPIEAHDV